LIANRGIAAAGLLVVACARPPDAPSLRLGPATPTTDDDLVAEADAADPLVWRWTVDGAAADVDGAVVPADRTARGERWEVSVAARRGDVEGAAATAAVVIVNAAPTATLTLPTARSGAPLTAAATTADPDGDPVTLDWAWQVDGVPHSTAGDTVHAEALRRGATWTVTVTPNDGDLTGAAATATTTVGNGLPTVAATWRPDPPRAVDDLLVDATTADPDGDSVEVTVRWRADGADLPTAGLTLPAGLVRRGQRVEVELTPRDPSEPGESLTLATTVANTAPEGAAATLTAPLAAGVVPVCAGVGWFDADGDPPGWTYTWTVNGAAAPGAETLAPGVARRGDVVRCAATPTDPFDVGAALLSAEVVVDNSPPTLVGAAITPGAPTVATALSVIPLGLTDPDGDAVELDVTWEVNGALASVLRVLPAGVARRGDVVRATVIAHDDELAAAPVTTPAITVTNAPPSATDVRLDPDPPHGGVPLRAAATATDPDGDPVRLDWTWQLNGATLPVTAEVLPQGLIAEGDVLAGAVTPFDGLDWGPASPFGPYTVVNAPPVLQSVRVEPDALFTDSVAACVWELVPDVEGEVSSISVQWTVDGRVAGADPTLDGAAFDRGQAVRCVVIAEDGVHPPAIVASAEHVVRDAPARILGASWSHAAPTRRDTVTVVVDGVADPDPGDTWTLTVRWQVNGVLVSEAPTLPPDLFRRGDVLVATVSADGEAPGEPLTLDPVVVVNAPPWLLAPTIGPTPAWADTSLVAGATIDDPDGDEVVTTWAWTVNGVDLADGAEGVLPPGPYRRGDLIEVTGAPFDGVELGPTAAAPPVRVADRPPAAPTVALSPRWPTAGLDDLRCLVVAGSTDADGDRVTYTMRWTVDGVVYPRPGDAGPASRAWPGDVVPAADLRDGETWTCTVTPADLSADGDPTAAVAVARSRAFAGLASGDRLSCALDAGGAPRCWGLSDDREGTLPATPARRLAVGRSAACAILTTGDLSCRGDLPAAPAGLFVDVALGGAHGCALRTNGQLQCWGATAAPPLGAGWASVTAGDAHTCALDVAGAASCWGDDSAGQLAVGPGPWRALAAGGDATCAVDSAGAATCWGGPLALRTPPPGPLFDVTVAGGWACALDAADHAVCWGDNAPAPPPGAWAELSAGADHLCAPSVEGGVACWGAGEAGVELPPDTVLVDLIPGPVGLCAQTPALRCWGEVGAPLPAGDLTAVALGDGFGCGVDPAGDLQCWGAIPSPPPLSDVVSLGAGVAHACALTAAGELACWGDDGDGRATPPSPLGWTALAVTDDHTCALELAGLPTCWGDDDDRETFAPAEPLSALATGAAATCGVTTAGELRCWGRLDAPPVGVGWRDLALGDAHGCALDPAGDAVCWGDDRYGQASPPPGPFTALRAAAFHTCGLTAAGDARCWGLLTR
jgi:hypothetical protein